MRHPREKAVLVMIERQVGGGDAQTADDLATQLVGFFGRKVDRQRLEPD